MKTIWIVRALAGGCVIGGCLENMFGKPLTESEARKMADFENERSRKRREQKLGGCFDYAVDSFQKEEA